MPPSREFDFRHEAPQSIQERMQHSSRDQDRDQHDRRIKPRNRDRGRRRLAGPPRRAAPGAHERPLMFSRRERTPEQLSGMHQDGADRFMGLDDVSESEEEMDLETDSSAAESVEASKADSFPTKGPKAVDPPKWSNPDPYTVLPPVTDEVRAKKRDVVKLIRKARIAAAKPEAGGEPVTVNDDFISLSFGDDSSEQLIPTGPKAMTERLAHLTNGTNGTNGVSKKRKRDDVEDLSPPPPYMMKKGKKSTLQIRGDVLGEWRTTEAFDKTPWCDCDHSGTISMGFWLHKEICDFYEYARPQRFERVMRAELMDRLEDFLSQRYPKSTLHSFGSFAAELYLPNADMDVVLLSEDFVKSGRKTFGYSNNWYHKLGSALESEGLTIPGSVEVIAKAKVPLVKFIDRITGIRVDLSFENSTGLVANKTFQMWKEKFPAMPIIVTIVKQFLAMRGLNEVVNGGLGGFSVTCLVVSLLQNMPQIQSGNMIPEHHLGEVLLEFLDLYGNRFEKSVVGVKLNPPGYFEKRKHPFIYFKPSSTDRLAIEDPNDNSNDISGGSSNINAIFRCFSKAFDDLQSRMYELHRAETGSRRVTRSILAPLLEGNYIAFDWHRNRLRSLYQANE